MKTRNEIMLVMIVVIGFLSCRKETYKPELPKVEHAPLIQFKKGPGYVYSDTTIGAGDSVKVGVICLIGEVDRRLNYVTCLRGEAQHSSGDGWGLFYDIINVPEYSKDVYLRNYFGENGTRYTFNAIDNTTARTELIINVFN